MEQKSATVYPCSWCEKELMMISVYGGTGFIGSTYYNLFNKECIIIPRHQKVPETNNILYFISTVHNYNVFDDPRLDIETNLNLLVDILETCKDKKDMVFNFISSWFVYGKIKNLPAKEDSYCNPKGFYSITKRAAEQLLISYCETFNIKYRILRLCNVYGETDFKVSKKKNAMQYLINEIIEERDINLYDGGKNIRDYMYVSDVVCAIKHCLENAPTNEIINIGSGKPHRIRDIMEYVRDKVGSKSNFISVEAPEFHKVVQIKDMYLDVEKLKNLGFEQKHDIWEGLDIIIDNMSSET